jgi:flagellar assembly protein FliH
MATVIKASSGVRAGELTAFALDDFSEPPTDALEQARRRAAEILELAEQEAIAIRRRAEDEARTAALETAEQVVQEKLAGRLDSLWPALEQAVDGVRAAKAEWLAHWERAALKVATAIAARVIRREVECAPQITLELVREALELAAGSADIQLRMHPEDHEALGGEAERIVSKLARLGNPEIVPDDAIERGGCRIDTRFGSIDQQFAAQLARIEEELS